MNGLENEQAVIKRSSQLHSQIQILLQELEELIKETKPSLSSHDRQLLLRSTVNKIIGFINEFEINPRLLDKSLEFYIHQLAELYLSYESSRPIIGEIVYNFGKIREFKVIINYFPSELYLINRLITITKESIDEFSVFLGLCWLCTLSLLPFSLVSIDQTIPQTMYDLGMKNLQKYSNGSKNQVISSILLSKLLVRNDCTELFELFYKKFALSDWVDLDDTYKVGYYLTINKILKSGLHLSSQQLSKIQQCITNDILLKSSPSNLKLLFSIKILSKISINYIQKGEFDKVASIINILINDILLEISSLEFNLRYNMAKSLSRIVASLSEPAINYKKQLIDFIFANLYEIDDEMSIAKNHTILLTFGYLSLNKVIMEEYIPRLIDIFHKSVFLQIKNQRVDLGSCIRDSSCFIMWSIVKNNRKMTSDQLSLIFNDLLKVLVFDKELVLKKCSIATLQELIGRYGTAIFQNDRFNDEELGSFIVKFLELMNKVKLKPKSINYDVIDLLFDTIDLKFLLPPLINEICETSGDQESAKYLNKLLLQPTSLPLVGAENSIDALEITNKLIEGNRWQYLFALPEVPYAKLSNQFSNFEFQHDHDILKAYLIYLVHTDYMTDLHWENVMKILKHGELALVEEIGQFLKSRNALSHTEALLNAVRNNMVLSKVVFNFNHWTNEQLLEIVSVLKNPVIDIEIRQNLLTNLNENYDIYPIVNELYQLFDDYTTTIQGDVGSKLRFLMLELVQQHGLMNEDIRCKLIRLSGELMDKIRFLSFELISGKPVLNENYYWKGLFSLYIKLTDLQEKVQFWKGCCFSISSFKGNPKVINQSFLELLRYGPKIEDFEIWLDLLENAPTSARDQKLKLMILQMLLKLFQSNFQFRDLLNYNQLFTICYHIYVKGKNVTQAITILKIFYHMSTDNDININLKSKIYQIFTRIIDGKFYNRLKINEIILQLLIDKNINLDRYQQINWTELKQDDKLYLKSFLNSGSTNQ